MNICVGRLQHCSTAGLVITFILHTVVVPVEDRAVVVVVVVRNVLFVFSEVGELRVSASSDSA